MSKKLPRKGGPPPARLAARPPPSREEIRKLIDVMFAGKQASLASTLSERLHVKVFDSTPSRWVMAEAPTQPDARNAEVLWALIDEMNTDQENKDKAEEAKKEEERRQWKQKERERLVQIFLGALSPNTGGRVKTGGELTDAMIRELGDLFENNPDVKSFFRIDDVNEGDDE